VLLGGPVVVIELKGKAHVSTADLDQVAAYVRDLRCYHRECADRPVHAVLVPTRYAAPPTVCDGVHVVAPADLDETLRKLAEENGGTPLARESFLDPAAYRPLPTLVQAARELFFNHRVREIWRASAATEPAVAEISNIAHEAARTRTRHLVLVSGVPGSGKTLVGLRAVHAHYVDDLAAHRGREAAAAAVFLSGNDPLVTVLQYELRGAGGGGKTFVRRVKDFLSRYVPQPELTPSEHVIVFDEAQRAFDAAMVEDKHPEWAARGIVARSEPEHFVEIGSRLPAWCVLVGLIGHGQEIHKGEEAGLAQWRTAIESTPHPEAWTVHAPGRVSAVFHGSPLRVEWTRALDLDTELRFHLVAELHTFVDRLLRGDPAEVLRAIADRLHQPDKPFPGGLRLLVTRDLDAAKRYLSERYADHPDARFGIVASSKDKDLGPRFGIPNDYQSTKRVNLGPWYSEGAEGRHSCRHLTTVVTEFGAQGLELDMALLAWGTDLVRHSGKWSIAKAGRYRGTVPVRDPMQLRLNAYRVLLTRGRDGTVVFVPGMPELDETCSFLEACGFRAL
jgi:hypothetical protein